MKRWLVLLLCVSAPALAQPSYDVDFDASDEEEEAQEEAEEEAEEELEADPELELEPSPPPDPVWTKAGVDQSVRRALEGDGYRFCKDAGYRVQPRDRWLCDFAPSIAARCPQFAEACKQSAAGGATRDSVRKKREADSSLFEVPAGLSMLASALFWLIVVGGAVALIIAIIRNLVGRHKDDEAAQPGAAPVLDESAPAVARLVETDVERLLARARAAAARGDYDQGVADAYAALLRHLDAHGLVHLHSSATNGDFVRGLREHPELQRDVRAIVRDVDRVQFGSTGTSRETFDQILRRVLPLVARGAMLALLFGALLSPLACAGRSDDSDQAAGAFRDSPGGHSLFFAALKQRGATVQPRIEKLEAIDDEIDLLVVLDELEPDEWRAVLEWIERGGAAIIGIDPGAAGPALHAERGDACSGPFALNELWAKATEPVTIKAPAGPTLVVDDEHVQAIIECNGKPSFGFVAHGEGRAHLLDDALLTNASFVSADNAYVVLDALGTPARVQVVDQWTGGGASTPFAAVANARLLPALGQLFLLLLVLALWRGIPFGRLREPPERARRAFADHVRALGLQYEKARATRLVLGAYAGWALDRLRDRALPSSRTSLIALAEAVAARTGRDEREVMRVLVEAEAAREDTTRHGSTPEDLKVMKQLEELLFAMGGSWWTSRGSGIVSGK